MPTHTEAEARHHGSLLCTRVTIGGADAVSPGPAFRARGELLLAVRCPIGTQALAHAAWSSVPEGGDDGGFP